jgi:DNA-binding MarR family transcriptional regulator
MIDKILMNQLCIYTILLNIWLWCMINLMQCGENMDKKTFSKQPSLCQCTNMRRASRAITQFYDKLLEPSGLKVTQYSLLNHLKRLGPLTMNELSQAIRLERTTLVRNLQLLETVGLVTISAEKQSKGRLVHLTEKGLQSLERAFPYWTQAQQYLKGLLTEEEICIFRGVLQKLESIVP